MDELPHGFKSAREVAGQLVKQLGPFISRHEMGEAFEAAIRKRDERWASELDDVRFNAHCEALDASSRRGG